MGKYFTRTQLEDMSSAAHGILDIRNEVRAKYGVDLLSTDTLSLLMTYKTTSRYDENFNVNLARNKEDGKSGNTYIEIKNSSVEGRWTERGNIRKNANCDASFAFHALGDLKHDRYIFVARNKTDLKSDRLYDISNSENCEKVHQCLLDKRNAWLEKGRLNEEKMKHDAIFIDEKFLLNFFPVPCTPLVIDGVKVFKDW